MGENAISQLKQETGVEEAPSVFELVRRLVHYYRATLTGLPSWIENFVITGYGHYATLLPQAFADRGTTPEQIAGMLGFIFTLESLALSIGCNRSQCYTSPSSASTRASNNIVALCTVNITKENDSTYTVSRRRC
ncbi:MAG: hypothetical protein IGS39_18595 [Calothrix sp. C42_A2020_038]|nr:hypothetical protein [Calothrix sp. C42_A2020_038]